MGNEVENVEFAIIEKMSKIQVFRNDPKILPKIKNKILRLMVKFV